MSLIEQIEARQTVEARLRYLGYNPSPSASQSKTYLAQLLYQGSISPDEIPVIANHYITLREDASTRGLCDSEVAQMALLKAHTYSGVR